MSLGHVKSLSRNTQQRIQSNLFPRDYRLLGFDVQWGMLQRTMLQRTNVTTNECYNERMLQRKNATTNYVTMNECYNERCCNERMLQRTIFINKIRMSVEAGRQA
jgi:hypothetical protein